MSSESGSGRWPTKLLGRSWLPVVAVCAAQTLVLVSIIASRIALLTSGREIVVEVVPVDPRDMFRGDYVVLGYDFGRAGQVEVPDETRTGDAVFVTLLPKGEAKWEIQRVTLAYPRDVTPEGVVLKGWTLSVTPRRDAQAAMASIEYGIESYFVPEGEGKTLEANVRSHTIRAALAVGRSGQVAIKALIIDGKRGAEQPLL